MLDVLSSIPKLANLSVNGNELAKLPSFRKRLIFKCGRKLSYIDRPVDELEHLAAAAFNEGGIEAERAAKEAWREQVKTQRTNETAVFRQWQVDQREKRKAELAEGTSLYKKLTPEEIAHNEAEANAAAEAERRMLDAGIENVARKFHQMDTGSSDLDSMLASATDAVLSGAGGLPATAEEYESLRAKQEADATIAEANNSNANPLTCVEEEVAMAMVPPAPPTPEEEAATAAQDAAKAELVELERVTAEETRQQEAEHQALVNESMAIYNQLRKGGADAIARAPATTSSTWANGGSAAAVVGSEDRPLYWSEAMDIELARQVKACVFDFDAIAEQLQKQCKGGHFGLETMNASPRLTAEECRLHWAKLDASQWCEEAPDCSALHTNFKINVQPSSLPGGVQPSFDEIALMAKGAAPKYLRTPTAFPSVQDGSSDDEDDENIEPRDTVGTRLPILAAADDEDLSAMD